MGRRGPETSLTAEIIEAIGADIRAGAFDHVAARRAGYSRVTFFKWWKRGERESDERLVEHDYPAPPSLFEQFYHAVEEAKAEARHSAETRMFRSNPGWWLSHGYARADWRESSQFVRAVQDEVAAQVAALLNFPESETRAPHLTADELTQSLRLLMASGTSVRVQEAHHDE
jgi:hypothetical protein